jgi:hypothetical protein
MNISEHELKFIGTYSECLESNTKLRRIVEYNAFSCMGFKVNVEKAYRRREEYWGITEKYVENDNHEKKGDHSTFCVYVCHHATISFTYGPSRFKESLILKERLGEYADIIWDIDDKKACKVLTIEIKDKQKYIIEFILCFVGVDINIIYRDE